MLLVGVVVTGSVALGGMRSITFVQAFQYWLKLTALAVPILFLVLHWQADGRTPITPADGLTFPQHTTVVVREPGCRWSSTTARNARSPRAPS